MFVFILREWSQLLQNRRCSWGINIQGFYGSPFFSCTYPLTCFKHSAFLHVCVKNQTSYVSVNNKNWAFTSPSINIIPPRKSYQNKDQNSLERFYCKLRWFSTITCLQPSSFLNKYISRKLITLRLLNKLRMTISSDFTITTGIW